jgi:hypothetical protein
VLMNARKHERGGARLPAGFADPLSSAPWFEAWKRPQSLVFGVAGARRAGPGAHGQAPVVPPRTWLLRIGVRRTGGIDPDDGPT